MSSKVKEFEINESKVISGIIIFEPTVNIDHRGSLFTTFHSDVFNQFIPEGLTFKHDKFSKSYNNVLRGIHGDTKSWKLVTAVYGKIFQVVVDCRPQSKTYLQWQSFEIDADKPKLILLPPGIGNAFYVMSQETIYHYKLAYEGEYFDANDQFTMKWNDSRLSILWPTTKPTLSDRDK